VGEPTSEEIAKRMDIPVSKVRKVLKIARERIRQIEAKALRKRAPPGLAGQACCRPGPCARHHTDVRAA
jgi:DNA-directed RNA polymerase sigma subunit (sigma70/sigma32)